MSEYIDREEFLKRLNVLYNVLDNLEKMLYSSQLIELVDIPTADVIEREKINKAIDEIQKLRSCSDGIIDDVEDILDKLIESGEDNGNT